MKSFEITSLLSPLTLIMVGLIMKFLNNENQFGILLKYRKYWWVLVVSGLFLIFMIVYEYLYLV
jgi:hypothetical protein